MANVEIKKAWNYDTRAESKKYAKTFTKPSKTVQSEKENCDINVIVRRFGVTGVVPGRMVPPLTEAHFDDVFDFQSAMNAVRAAEESFMSLSSDVRSRFSNDPQKFLEFCSNPENLPEMRKLGLAIPEPTPVPDPPPKGDDSKE